MASRLNGRAAGELRPVRIQRRYTRHAEGEAFTRAELDALLDLAARGIAELVRQQKKSLGL